MLRALRFFIVFVICICVGHAKSPSKLIGGRKAAIESFPYQVQVFFGNDSLCAASIVDERHVITAASCIVLEPGVILADLRILRGTNNQNIITSDGIIHNVSLAIIHEKYDPKNFWINDIAILRLETPIKYSKVSSPIQLPSYKSMSETASRALIISGWGGSSDYLQSTNATVLSHVQCQEIFMKFLMFHDSQRCFVTPRTETRVVKGDGGCPLTIQGILVGVLSVHNVAKEGEPLPSVFTDVKYYTEWIKDMLDKF